MKDITKELENLEDDLEWLLSSPASIEKFSNLHPVEKKVLVMRINKATPYNEIAVELGLTRERVKSLHKSTLEKIIYTVLKSIEEENDRIRNNGSIYERMKQMDLRLSVNEEKLEKIEGQMKLYNTSYPPEISTIKIYDIPGLSARIKNTFDWQKIHTIGDLLSYSKQDLLKLRNFGKKSLKELETALLQYEIKF